nr:3-keto-5-aminohexanoate cleavage protein [Actinomycetospora cinnamomea]
MLQCCLNGARPAGAYPAVPMSPRHLARDARAVSALGVHSVHVHPRDRDGRESLDPPTVGAVTHAIRAAAPRTEIGVTTARWVEPDPLTRIDIIGQWGRLPAHARPDVASVNVHERGWQRVCAALVAAGIGVELGVWTCGDAVQLRQAGLPPGTIRVLAEVTVTDPEIALIEAMRILDALGPLPAPILLHGEDAGAWPVLAHAQRLNLDTRIGFEDTLEGPERARRATSNEQLVRYALDKAATPQRADRSVRSRRGAAHRH